MNIKGVLIVILCLMIGLTCAACTTEAVNKEPEAVSGVSGAADLGLSLQQADDGLYVMGVRDSTAADEYGITAGDMIVACDGNGIGTIEEFDTKLASMMEGSLCLTLRHPDGKTEDLTIKFASPGG